MKLMCKMVTVYYVKKELVSCQIIILYLYIN